MSSNEREQDTNRAWWDERAAFHLDTPLYQTHLRRLESGGLALLPLDVAALGDLTGLRVLHLQCHVGTDTVSLTRMGAKATGVDFSSVAIEMGRKLAHRLNLTTDFETCEIKDVGRRFAGQFDRVFTAHGVLPWLPDLDLWAGQIAQALVPGGALYLCDSHPFANALAEENTLSDRGLVVGLPYLSQASALGYDSPGSYADLGRATTANQTFEWSWGLGDVVTALTRAGLHIDWLREHPEGFYPFFPEMVEGADGHFRLPAPLHGQYPLTFSLQATKG